MADDHDFTAAQLADLKRLGVTTEQVAELRKHLWFIAWTAERMPSTADIQSRLADVANHARALAKALQRLEGSSDMANPPDPAANAAAWMLAEAHGDRKSADWSADPERDEPTNPDPFTLRLEIDRLAEIADDAVNYRLRKETGGLKQTRTQSADPRIIGRIDNALWRGWDKTYGDPTGEKPLPEYPFWPSYAEGWDESRHPFRAVARICLETAGRKPANPDRAIKTYLKLHHEYKARKGAKYGRSEK